MVSVNVWKYSGTHDAEVVESRTATDAELAMLRDAKPDSPVKVQSIEALDGGGVQVLMTRVGDTQLEFIVS